MNLTPNEAASKLIVASDTLRLLIDEMTELDGEHLRAKRVYELAFAHVFRQSEGSVELRKYTATEQTRHEREVMDEAARQLRHHQEQVRWIKTDIEVWRTVTATLRDEWKASA